MTETKQIHSYAHCRACGTMGLSSRIEAGITPLGLQIWCKRHDKEIAHFTPDDLATFIARGRQCECCPNGMHRS
jgi:hypothetical protein